MLILFNLQYSVFQTPVFKLILRSLGVLFSWQHTIGEKACERLSQANMWFNISLPARRSGVWVPAPASPFGGSSLPLWQLQSFSQREKAKGLSTHAYRNPLSVCIQDLNSLARQLGQAGWAIHPLEDGAWTGRVWGEEEEDGAVGWGLPLVLCIESWKCQGWGLRIWAWVTLLASDLTFLKLIFLLWKCA